MPELFKPPRLAEGIQASAAPRHLKREFWRLKVQEDLCPALARNAAALTKIAAERQKNDSEALIEIENLLVESSVLTANAIWQETQSRKTLMAPAFNPALRNTLKKSETTTSLYGDKTLELAKGQLEMKSIMATRTKLFAKGEYNPNFRRGQFRPYQPAWPYQTNYQMGPPQNLQQPTNAPQQIRPNLPSRGKKASNQPFNPRMLTPAYPRGAPRR